MKKTNLAVALGALLVVASAAQAVPVTLTGNFVRATITDAGVLNSLRYDATGARIFPNNRDYVSPGIPFEGFEVRTSQGNGANSNSGGQSIAQVGSLIASSDISNGGSVTWNGANSLFQISHRFSFSNTSERVDILTTLTAVLDLTNVRVSRAVDPDPDNFPGGSASTNNQRGIATATPPVPTSDFVGSLGSISGLPLGLFYSGPIAHNTGIVGNCCSITNPDTYLAGGDRGNSSSGDHGIGLAWNLGNIGAGQAVSWSYAYVMGGSLGTIDIPGGGGGGGGGTVPEPNTMALFAAIALAAGFAARRKRS